MNWEPIASAPKDGTDIVVLYELAGQKFARVAYYMTRPDWMTDKDWEMWEEGWWSFRSTSVQEMVPHSPTHWIPLPSWQEVKP